MKLGIFSFGLALLLVPSLAFAQPEDPDAPAPPLPSASPPPAAPAAPAASAPAYVAGTPAAPAARYEGIEPRVAGPPRYDYFRFGTGFRIGYVDDRGFDTFASDDVLAQVSVDGSYAFITKGKVSISAGAAYDVGSRSSDLRGLGAKLTIHRLTVPIEARYYLAPWVNVFAKAAPGTALFNARVTDPSAPESLEASSWVFAADLSAGASFRVLGSNDHATRSARLWVTHELGYGITSSKDLAAAPNRHEEDILGADRQSRLGAFAANGVFWRTGLAVTF